MSAVGCLLFVQAVFAGGGTVSSAFTKKRIKVAEARQILGFEEASEVSGLTKEDVMEAYGKLFDLNDPSDGGSLYLQAKVYHAKESLLEELGVPPEERELPEHGDGDSDDDDTDEKKAQEQVQAEADERR